MGGYEPYSRKAKQIRAGGTTAEMLAGKRRARVNVYICEDCRHALVSRDVDDGVTPFITRCTKCDGKAYSCMYRAPTSLDPEIEWYKPSPAELSGAHPATLEHCRRGGLLRRDADSPERAPCERSDTGA